MADARSIIEAIKATKPMEVVNHPFAFALGVGAANGLLAAVRGKHIDLRTGLALTAILGVGETVIAAWEPGEHKHSNAMVALYSVLGVGIGLLPFLKFEWAAGEGGKGFAVAEAEREKGDAVA